MIPYLVGLKQRGPEEWGGACNTTMCSHSLSWRVTPTTPPVRPALGKSEEIR
jgi:hypothetical protein